MAGTGGPKAVEPSGSDRWHSYVARHGRLLQVGGTLLFAVALFVVTYVAFPRTTVDSYLHEVVVAALGAIATVVTAVIAAFLALWRELSDRRENERANRFDERTWRRSSIQVGRMEIQDIVVVASCGKGNEWTSKVRYEFQPLAGSPRSIEDLTLLTTSRLPEIQARAAKNGQVLANDPCIDLVGASMVLTRDHHGRRVATYRLVPALSSYFDFVVSSADLDSPAPLGDAPTLREHWGRWPASIEEVGQLPAPAKVGVGTSVVTSDGRLVLGVRGRTYMVGQTSKVGARSPVHVVAEGMLPCDLNAQGRMDPRETALRGVREELNIGATVHDVGRVSKLWATGFFFDQSRWQPCFSYLAETDLTWGELQTVAPMARDYWETERLVSFPFDIESPELRHLLTGSHPRLELASNHAAAVLWFALLHKHGFFVMRDTLADASSLFLGVEQVGKRSNRVAAEVELV